MLRQFPRACQSDRKAIAAFALRSWQLLPIAAGMLLTLLGSAALSLPQFVPPPPPDRGEPGNRSQGGGRRSPACDRYDNLAALVPSIAVRGGSIRWGLTTMAHPTLWLTAPAGLAAETPIQLVLYDDDRPIYHSTHTAIESEAGSFSLSLANAAAPLEAGKLYRWNISVFCDPDVPDVPIQLEGYIERVAIPASLENALDAADPLQQAMLYARAGIWYDALTVLGNQYRQKTTPEIARAWLSLLQQADLERSSSLPIESCCR